MNTQKQGQTPHVVGWDLGSKPSETVLAVRDQVHVTVKKMVGLKEPVRFVAAPGWRWVERDGYMQHEPIEELGT